MSLCHQHDMMRFNRLEGRYSQDLGPIEKMWSKVKAILRKPKARTETELIVAIANTLEQVNENDCLAWFASCG